MVQKLLKKTRPKTYEHEELQEEYKRN